MHPNKTFEWTDRGEMLRFAAQEGFAHVFAASSDELFVAHAPLLVTEAGAIRFHLSRRNRIVERLDSRRALVSLVGRHAYQSANWYVSGDQVPTWNYEAVEIEGPVRQLSDDELVELLDGLSGEYEGRAEPERPWTRGKMDAAKFEAMTKAIAGYELVPDAVRGTRKFNQHKPADDLAATIAGQTRAGRADIVAAIREVAKAQ